MQPKTLSVNMAGSYIYISAISHTADWCISAFSHVLRDPTALTSLSVGCRGVSTDPTTAVMNLITINDRVATYNSSMVMICS